MLGTMSAQTARFPITPIATPVANVLFFPLSLAPVEFWSAVMADGGDIRVTTQDGVTACARQIVSFDPVNKTGSVWFNPGAGTAFYISSGTYQPEPAVDAASGKYAVWGSNAALVMHLNDLSDSCAVQNAITATETDPSPADGYIGRCYAWSGAAEKYINVAGSVSNTVSQFTVLLWCNPVDNVGFRGLVSRTLGNNAKPFDMYIANGTQNISFNVGNGTSSSSYSYTVGAGLLFGQWSMIAMSYDGSKLRGYYNGALVVGPVTPSAGTPADGGDPIKIGTRGDLFTKMKGSIDEVRLFKSAISDAAIAQIYANQSAPATFWSVGSIG
jgi:hypothetical protein